MSVREQGFHGRIEPSGRSPVSTPTVDGLDGRAGVGHESPRPLLHDDPIELGFDDGVDWRSEPDDVGPQWVRLVLPVAIGLLAAIGAWIWFGGGDGDGTGAGNGAPDGGVLDTTPALPATTPGASDDPDAGLGNAAAGVLAAREVDFVDVDPNTLWVSPTMGDDGSDGQTPDTPWQSLQAALDRAQPGQTIYLMTGEYTDSHDRSAHFVAKQGGTAEAWVTVTAGPGEQPVIVATSGNGLVVRASYVEVSGIEVRGQGFSEGNPYGWGLMANDAHHVRFAANRVSGMAVGGIGAIGTANLEVLGNEVFDNSFWGTEQGSGISIWHATDHGTGPNADGYHDLIVGNVVYRNENRVYSRFRSEPAITDGNGIIIDQTDETGYTGRTLVANNLVFDNGGRAVLVLESSRVDVFHNTTYGNGRTDILEGGPVELAAGRADDVRFMNNLAWSRPGLPALLYNTSTNVVTGGNLLISSNQGPYTTDTDVVIDADPGLVAPGVDPATVDFAPQPGSTATQVALELDRPVLLDGNGRPRSGRGAVGAFEPVAPVAATD